MSGMDNPGSPRTNEYGDQPLMLTDLDFFEQEMQKYQEVVRVPLMERRVENEQMKENPMEELQDVYVEVAQMETSFGKVINIAEHLIRHYRELFQLQTNLQDENDELKNENQTFVSKIDQQDHFMMMSEQRDR